MPDKCKSCDGSGFVKPDRYNQMTWEICRTCKPECKDRKDQRLQRYIGKHFLGIEFTVDELKAALDADDNKKIREELDALNTHHEDLEAYLTGDDSAL